MGKDQDIKILTDVEHVLKRPLMYVGRIDPDKQEFWIPTTSGKMEKKEIEYIPAAYKIFNEVLDNSLDEHIRGFGDVITISIDKETGFYAIEDRGRGIPIDIHKEAKVHTPQVVFTQLRSGSNFDDTDRQTVGMNGVGAALATIFSEKLVVQVRREGKLYQQTFSKNLSKISEPFINKDDKKKRTGTLVKFKPDPNIFKIPIPEELIHKRCLDLVYMYPKLTINLKIVGEKDDEVTKYEGSKFEEYLKRFDSEYSYYEDKSQGIKAAILFNKMTDNFEQVSNVNGADTFRGGTHIDGLKEILCEHIKTKIKDEFKLEVSNADISKKMLLVLFQNYNAPQFEGQTKEKLATDKVALKKIYEDAFSSRRLTSMLSELPTFKQAIVDEVLLKNEKKDLKDLKDRQKGIDRKKIAKLIEASGRDRSVCSIYITEGDSAISTLASVRDSKTMAGLPLRGKVMNVLETSAKDVLENKEIQSIMSAIGLKIGESPLDIKFNKVEKSHLNYGKIVIATDQDMDGYSIRCLLINFFFKFWPELVQYGFVYILETPLYEIIDHKEEDIHYFYNKEDYEKFIKNKNTNKFEISYFKGLGSCGKDAWNYMINTAPNLIQVQAKDVKETTEILKMAFGLDPEVRKKWLTE